MPCKTLRPGGRSVLPICAMSLRPLPTDTRPGDHVVLIDPARWHHHLHVDEECLCHTPHLEWCVTPLGAAVELCWGSANHRLCIDEPRRAELYPHAHPGIVAECLFVDGDIDAFVARVLANTVAAHHILALPESLVNPGALRVEAQHCVRAAFARAAARAAVEEILR